MPEAPFALHGYVLTPEEALKDHYLVVSFRHPLAQCADTAGAAAAGDASAAQLTCWLALGGCKATREFVPVEWRDRAQDWPALEFGGSPSLSAAEQSRAGVGSRSASTNSAK